MEGSNFPQPETKTTEKTPAFLSTEKPGSMNKVSNGPSLGDQSWQEWIDLAVDFLSRVPEELGGFFSDYKKPLLTVFIFLAGGATVYITLAVLDAIDDIPLLGPTLELVGLGYSAWFVYRYLWKASSRDEFLKEFNAFKSQVIGQKSQNN